MAQPVSIVVVSRGRPMALAQCLTGLGQLDYPCFEIIVVACPDGQAIVRAHPNVDQIKLVPFDEPNISIARNLGVAQAAGDIVAFIDDDAVPEPLWLQHLTGPFDQSAIAAAGGYVIGRNGISFQWTAREVYPNGASEPLELPISDAPAVLPPAPGRAIKTEGTNMAFRRNILCQIGGFDPGFHFYLDETDLNMRLGRSGYQTAIVPLAQVHHGFAESDRREASRVPKDLTQIGASQRLFLRKHCPAQDQDQAWTKFCEDQRLRLFRFAKQRKLGAARISELLRGLQDGGKEGLCRDIGDLPPIPHSDAGFCPYPGRPKAPRKVLSGRFWQARRLRREATELARTGAIVSMFIFSPTLRYHKVTFTHAGVWEQTGGRFGRSDRTQSLWRYRKFSERVREETARTSLVRGTQ